MRDKTFLRRTLTSVAIITGVTIGLAGCFGTTATPEPTKSGSVSPSPTPGGDGTQETPIVDSSAQWDGSTTELQRAQSLFPDAKATEAHTKDQVQLALYGAWAYTKAAYDNAYMANGSWFVDGLPATYVDDNFSRFFDLSYDGYVNSELETAKTTGDYNKLSGLFLFSDLRTGNLKPFKDCEGKDTAQSCLTVKGVTYSKWLYSDAKDGGINVNVTATATPQYEKLISGYETATELGSVEFKYENTYTMAENPFASEEANIPSYVIKGVEGKWTNTAWKTTE